MMASQWLTQPSAISPDAAIRRCFTIRRFSPDLRSDCAFKTLETPEHGVQIVWAWDKFVFPCLLLRIPEFIHI